MCSRSSHTLSSLTALYFIEYTIFPVVAKLTFAWQGQHFVHMDVLVRGRAGLDAMQRWEQKNKKRTFAWQVRHFDSLRIAGARLGAAGPQLRLHGRRSIWCVWTYFCVAGALRAHGRTCAQGQHFVPVLNGTSIGWENV